MHKIVIIILSAIFYIILLYSVIIEIKDNKTNYNNNIIKIGNEYISNTLEKNLKIKHEKKTFIINVFASIFSIIVIAMFLIAFLIKTI